jgi:two-component system sensor histidine kinase RegB
VEILADWNADDVSITIRDDGPGFAPEVVDRIGAPYVTHRPSEIPEIDGNAAEDPVFGLGLGLFIAKTLLERSGARLSMKNQVPPLHGAEVMLVWRRIDFERQPVATPLEPAAAVS